MVTWLVKYGRDLKLLKDSSNWTKLCKKSISIGSLVSKLWWSDAFHSNKLVVKKDFFKGRILAAWNTDDCLPVVSTLFEANIDATKHFTFIAFHTIYLLWDRVSGLPIPKFEVRSTVLISYDTDQVTHLICVNLNLQVLQKWWLFWVSWFSFWFKDVRWDIKY